MLLRFSETLVSQWLKSYMFKGRADAEQKGAAIAHWLADHSLFKTHARPISRDELVGKGLVISSLEQNQAEQDLFLSIHHAAAHTFSGTPAVKLIENNHGKAYVRIVQSVQIMQSPAPPSVPTPPVVTPQPAQPKKISFWKKVWQRLPWRTKNAPG
jgi:hypothetical protein